MNEIPKINIGLQKAPFPKKKPDVERSTTTKKQYHESELDLEDKKASELDIETFNNLRSKLSQIDPNKLSQKQIRDLNNILSQQKILRDEASNTSRTDQVESSNQNDKENQKSLSLDKERMKQDMIAAIPTYDEVYKYYRKTRNNDIETAKRNTDIVVEMFKDYPKTITEAIDKAQTNTIDLEFIKCIDEKKEKVEWCFRQIWDINPQKAEQFARSLGMEIFNTNEDVNRLVEKGDDSIKFADKRFINPLNSILIDSSSLPEDNPYKQALIAEYITYPGLLMQCKGRHNEITKILINGYSGIFVGPEIHSKHYNLYETYPSFEKAKEKGKIPQAYLDLREKRKSEEEKEKKIKKVEQDLSDWEGSFKWPLLPEKLRKQPLSKENVIKWLKVQLYVIEHPSSIKMLRIRRDNYSKEELMDKATQEEITKYVKRKQLRALEAILDSNTPELTCDLGYFKKNGIDIQAYIDKALKSAPEDLKKELERY